MDDQQDLRPRSTGSTYWISEGERAMLTDKADRGDKNAAYRLAQYYEFSEFDSEKERHWLERSASAGHAVAQYNLAFLLFNKENPDVNSALHWANMAKKNGEEKSQILIDEIHATLK